MHLMRPETINQDWWSSDWAVPRGCQEKDLFDEQVDVEIRSDMDEKDRADHRNTTSIVVGPLGIDREPETALPNSVHIQEPEPLIVLSIDANAQSDGGAQPIVDGALSSKSSAKDVR